MRFEWCVLEQEIEISFWKNSSSCQFQEWVASPTPEVFGSAVLIKELLENEVAKAIEGRVRLDFMGACNLSIQDRELLGFPPPFPYDLKIEAEGVLQQADFKFIIRFYTFDGGKELHGKIHGPVFELDDETKYFLSVEQFTAIEKIIEANAHQAKQNSLEEKLISLSEIKQGGDIPGIQFDGYLQNEEVIVPEKIGLKIKKENDSVELIPEIEGVDSPNFEKKFRQFPTGKSIYNLETADGKRKRVVFRPKEYEEIKKARKLIKPTGTDKERLLNQPQEIFDPEIVDLDQFSKRVKEIGYYKPRFYPFVCPYKSQWIPGFIAETTTDERARIIFPTPEALGGFEAAVKSGRQAGSSTIPWEENEIPIDEAEKILNTAKKQFKDTSKPVKEDSQAQKVLIIKENVDSLEHQENHDFLSSSQETFIHRYSAPPFLKPEFELLSHQKEGIAWLQNLCDSFSGGILADDLGLGKTLQVLSFILWHYETKNLEKKPYLIVAPVSLLENWENEFRRFFSGCPVQINRYYAEDAVSQIDPIINSLNESIFNSIVFTTYETMRKHQIPLGKIAWAACVLDEAQRIKTPGTLVTNAAKALKSNFKIAMTGSNSPFEQKSRFWGCLVLFLRFDIFHVPKGHLKIARHFNAGKICKITVASCKDA